MSVQGGGTINASEARRLVERGKHTTNGAATVDDWRAAVLAAWEALCRGTDGAFVRRNEPWELALVEEAAEYLLSVGLGRPLGGADDAEWERVVDAASRAPSCAADGMVQAIAPLGHDGALRLPISALQRAKRSTEKSA